MKLTDKILPASFLRRCGAIFYDLVILAALLIISTWVLMPFTQGNPISPGNFFYQIYLVGVSCGYYLFFWVNSGQTVGMKAWHIQVQTLNGAPLTWKLAFKRLAWACVTLAPCSIGLFTMLFHSQHQALYDVLAHTQCVRIQRQSLSK